jgi:hypothetical protein
MSKIIGVFPMFNTGGTIFTGIAFLIHYYFAEFITTISFISNYKIRQFPMCFFTVFAKKDS